MTENLTKSVLWLIERNGYTVTMLPGRVIATNAEGETYVVTGSDPYTLACELAENIGVELADG